MDFTKSLVREKNPCAGSARVCAQDLPAGLMSGFRTGTETLEPEDAH